MATHEISLRVQVSGPEQFSEVWQTFGLVSVGLGLKYPGAALSSILLDEEEKTHYDDETLSKVSAALRESGLSYPDIDGAINAMQNYGILFREREK